MLTGRKSSGFTLIEVMIALAIFAIVSTTLIKNATQTVSQSRIIQERSMAQWIAESEMQTLRLQPRTQENFLSQGTNMNSQTMGGREWQVEVDVRSTENELVRRVEITVFDEQDLDTPLANLSGFLGRY
ncbi:MAG: type II secretion system minor pseudopilin GspI [Pseudomonadales bacterium]|nr:type II secretion system minor pseudopilin GspI [Pseudomonadales bacterium]